MTKLVAGECTGNPFLQSPIKTLVWFEDAVPDRAGELPQQQLPGGRTALE